MTLKGHKRALARQFIGCLPIVASCLFSSLVEAQNVPIQVEVKQAIVDEFGKHLSRENGGDLVQFLFVNGHVDPPGIDGQPSTNNPVSYEAHVGYGMINHTTTVGRFSAAITPRSEKQIVARAFNAPTLAQASYYADSQVFTPNQGAVFYPVFGRTTNALDTADYDSDGLINSLEKSLGGDPNSVDSDGDGIGDMDEFRSGTLLNDSESYLQMVEIVRKPGGGFLVQWSSVEGKSYQVQYSADELSVTNVTFWNLGGVVAATSTVSLVQVTNSPLEGIKSFRVLLVE